MEVSPASWGASWRQKSRGCLWDLGLGRAKDSATRDLGGVSAKWCGRMPSPAHSRILKTWVCCVFLLNLSVYVALGLEPGELIPSPF